jgi:predicted esterase
LIKEQVDKGIKPSRIVLGGFSQGGAMSLFSGITNPEKLGGVFGLSCYMLLSDRIKNYIPENWPNKKTPFFIAHGTEDDVVPHEFGKQSAELAKELGLEDVTFNSYPYAPAFFLSAGFASCSQLSRYLQHSADPLEIEDLEKFLNKTIPPEDNGNL